MVSTDLPEVRAFAPDVATADDPEEFAAKCYQAIQSTNAETRKSRSERMAGHGWEEVTARVCQLVSEAIQERTVEH